MQCGLQLQTIRQIREILASLPAIEKAIIYESRAKGSYRNSSDIDLFLKYSIENYLDDLNLPYIFDI